MKKTFPSSIAEYDRMYDRGGINSVLYYPEDQVINPNYYVLANGDSLLRTNYPNIEKFYSSVSTETIVKSLFPSMTSNTTPSPYIAARSGVLTATNEAYYAFKTQTTTSTECWHSALTLPSWISISYNKNNYYRPKYYTIWVRNERDAVTQAPRTWNFQGCETVNGSTWENIDTRSSQTLYQNQKYTYNITNWSNLKFYAKFRLYVTVRSTFSSDNCTAVKELKIYGYEKPSYDNLMAYFIIPDLRSKAPAGYLPYIRHG